MKTISVLGLGYVGLPTAAVFADAGLTVLGVDVNQKAVDTINSGRAHIVEPGLDELLKTVVERGRLRASTEVEPSDVFIIAVPTPFKDDKVPDLKYIQSAAVMIAPLLRKGNLVILESTSPVGTTEKFVEWFRQVRPDITMPTVDGQEGDIFLAYCPERILPGKVIEEVVNNDRVIGGLTAQASALAVKFYQHAVKGKCHVTNCRTAELCKLSENAFRDTNIAFANELSIISDKFDVDVHELISLANQHPRVEILRPGTGVGGHCIAVDPWFIVDSAPEAAKIIRTAREINDSKPQWVADQIGILAEGTEKPIIACMGLAYKPDVDDLRTSPSVEVVRLLSEGNVGELLVCEPFVENLPESLVKMGLFNASADDAISRSNIVVFLTAHSEFLQITSDNLGSRKVFDACGLTRD